MRSVGSVDLFTADRLGDIGTQLECVKREIGLRRRVYPRQIQQGRIKRADADREIATMRGVLVSLETLRLTEEVERIARAIVDQNGHMLDLGLAAELTHALQAVERFRRTTNAFLAGEQDGRAAQ